MFENHEKLIRMFLAAQNEIAVLKHEIRTNTYNWDGERFTYPDWARRALKLPDEVVPKGGGDAVVR